MKKSLVSAVKNPMWWWLLLLLIALFGCSPYSQQIKRLDKAYSSGQIPAKQYWAERQQLIAADSIWQQNLAASINAGTASVNASTAAMNQATGARYSYYPTYYPQPVNVYVRPYNPYSLVQPIY